MRESRLFTPFSIRGLELRNRIARSATAESLADESGAPTDRLAPLYRQLAEGGTGLIVTGHLFVAAGGKAHAEMTGIHEDRLVDPLAALACAAHQGGAAIAAQLNHGGRACDPALVAEPLAPSAVPASGKAPMPREMTMEDITEAVSAFAAAAARAKAAGFDAVQLHGAHGYLVSQFLSPLSNRRKDRYGGSLENRARFLQETARAVRRAVGDDFPVLIKLGIADNLDGGLTMEEGAEVASWLRGFGVDAVETSTGAKGAIATKVTAPDREAYLLPLARAVRARTDLPILLVGGLRSRAVMERVFDEGIDMVSLSRPLIREPDLPRELASGAVDAAACVSCNRCWPEKEGDGIACKSRR
jgi:2,4-dienoyl-CoA reductase-like NADH-dependent reductase (Old Yellow Enzyme family)